MSTMQTVDARTASIMKKIDQANAMLFRNKAVALDTSKHVIVRRHARNNARAAIIRLEKLRQEVLKNTARRLKRDNESPESMRLGRSGLTVHIINCFEEKGS